MMILTQQSVNKAKTCTQAWLPLLRWQVNWASPSCQVLRACVQGASCNTDSSFGAGTLTYALTRTTVWAPTSLQLLDLACSQGTLLPSNGAPPGHALRQGPGHAPQKHAQERSMAMASPAFVILAGKTCGV